MKYFLAALCLLTIACRTDKSENLKRNENQVEAKRNSEFNILLSAAGETRKATIATVQTFESDTKRLALVTYTLEGVTGLYNMAVEEPLDPNSLPEDGRTYVCNGLDCNCLVVVTVGSNGKYSLSCNCSSCELIIAESLHTTQFFNSL